MKKHPEIQKQHRLSQVYLKKFGYEENGVWMVSVMKLGSGMTENVRISEFTAEENIFDLPFTDFEIRRRFETLSGKLENDYPRLINNIKNQKRLTPKNKDLINHFVPNILCRTSHFRFFINLLIEEMETRKKLLNEIPKKPLQGLWAELFVIEQSKHPEKLIIGWHSIPEEKFDFSFGKLRLEVKSSGTEIRTHHFSSSQLNPINNTEIIIASILVNINAGGISLEEMLERINNKLNNYPKQKEKLHLLVYSVLGTDIDKISEVKFDFQLAQESFKLYSSIEIPKIENKDIPKEVSNVKFISNLLNSKSIDTKIDELIKPHINN